MEKIVCKTEGCDQILEIKIASGYKDPKNKGRKYTKCLKCSAFNWIEENQNPKTPEEFKQSLEAPVTPQKGVETREPVIEPKINPKVWEDKDLRIARESALHSATRNHNGHETDPDTIILEAELYVNYIYQGIKSSEDIEDIELPSETLKISSSRTEGGD